MEIKSTLSRGRLFPQSPPMPGLHGWTPTSACKTAPGPLKHRKGRSLGCSVFRKWGIYSYLPTCVDQGEPRLSKQRICVLKTENPIVCQCFQVNM